MGVSIEVWRARIGLFVGVMRSKSCLQRVWPHGKRRRTYHFPPNPPRKHHMPILICLLALAVLSATDGQDPGQTFRHGGRGCVVVISAAAWFVGTCFLKIEKWRNRLTLGLLILLVSLLLTCGDVESNPGPKGARPKKTYKIRLEETGQQFGTGASSMADIWYRISQKWDITSDDYIICEEDGTELEDDDYFQGLPNGSLVIVRCKSTNQNNDHQQSRPNNQRSLTHKMIQDIAVNYLPSDITGLGLAMGFTRVVIDKYQTENNENLPRSRGTERMIRDWIDGHSQRNNVDAFCHVLKKAELHNSADQIENGDFFSIQVPTISSDVLNVERLQTELRHHYCHRLCYMKMIPWREDSACSVEDYFIPLSLVRQKKVPGGANKDTRRCDSSKIIDEYNTLADSMTYLDDMVHERKYLESGISFSNVSKTPSLSRLHNLLQFPDYQFKDDYLRNSLVFERLPHFHNDIFEIRENSEICHRILVSGKPGIGKSTLTSKLAYDWVNRVEQSPLRNVPLLFVLSLSSVDIGSDISEEIVKQLLPHDTTVTASQINYYIQTHQEDVVLIYDGLDESPLLTQSFNETEHVGNIMKSIEYDVLTSCRILVTTRPWLEDELLSKLFRVYAQIQIDGFSMNSINEFVDKYCQDNQRLAKRVKYKISVDLHNLSHLFHVPLFLVMLCEMVREEMDISAYDTLTSFIQDVCVYLFTSCNSKTNCNNFRQKPLDETEMREYLIALGKIATQCIDTGGNATNEYYMATFDNGQLQKGLAIGLLSRKSVTEKLGDQTIKGHQNITVLYFCHGLLKDFCISYYLSSLPNPDLSSYVEKLLHGFGIFTFRYVMLFLCGLKQKVVPIVFKHLTEKELHNDIYKEFAVQCYFEGKIGNSVINTDIFSFSKCLVVDICHLNSFQAAKYLLSNSKCNSVSFDHFRIFGENIADRSNGGAADLITPFVLDPCRLDDIYLRCSDLTEIGLFNLMFYGVASQEGTELSGSCFKTNVIVFSCRDDTLLRNLLKTMMLHLSKLQRIQMVNISNANSDSNNNGIGMEFVLNFFIEIGCPLNSMWVDCLKKSKHSSERGSKQLPLLKSICLNKCGYAIPLHQNIASLGNRCPLLETLQISFSNSHHRSQTQRKSTDCISFNKIVSLLSVHCPNVDKLAMMNYDFDFKKSLPNFDKRKEFPIKAITLIQCKQLVHLSHTLYFLSYHFPLLEKLSILSCKINCEDSVNLPVTLGPYQSLKLITLRDIQHPVNMMSIMDVLCNFYPSVNYLAIRQCEVKFEGIGITELTNAYHSPKEAVLEDKILAPLKPGVHSLKLIHLSSCTTPVELSHIFSFLCYCSSLEALTIFNCDISFEDITGFRAMTTDHHETTFSLSSCTRPLPVLQIVDSICRCYSLSDIMVDNCEINFEPVKTSPVPETYYALGNLTLCSLKQPVNLVCIIDHLYRHCSTLKSFGIMKSELVDGDISDYKMATANPNPSLNSVQLLQCKTPFHLVSTFHFLGYLIPTSLNITVIRCDIDFQGISDLKEMNPHLTNHRLTLIQCIKPVCLPRTLDVLCHNCPSIDELRIVESEITLHGEYNAMTSDHHELSLVLSRCTQALPVAQIVDSVCQCCSLSCLTVDNCEINFEPVKTFPAPNSSHLLQHLILAQLTHPVNLVRVIDHLYRHCLTLESVTIDNSELVDEDISNNKITAADSNQCLKFVSLIRCKKSIHIARTFHPLGCIIPTSLNFLVQQCDINLQGISDFKETNSHLTNHTLTLIQCEKPVFLPRTLDVLCHYCPSIDRLHISLSDFTFQGEFNPVTSNHHKMQLILSSCTRPLPVIQIVDSVCRCCSLSRLVVGRCEINFEPIKTSPAPTSNHLIQRLSFDNLTHPINLVSVIDNLHRTCPSLVELTIENADLINEDITDSNMTVVKPNRCFKRVILILCKTPVHLVRIFQPLGCLIPTSLEFIFDRCDIDLQDISDFKETKSHLSHHPLTLIQCMKPVCLPRTLNVLCRYCPSISRLQIFQSEITLQGVFNTKTSDHRKMILYLSQCTRPLPIAQIVDSVCLCRSLSHFIVEKCEIDFEHVISSPAPKPYDLLEQLILADLIKPVNFLNLVHILYRHCPLLVEVLIRESEITNEEFTDIETTVAKPNRCFEKVHLILCKKPIDLARTFQPLGHLIPTSLEFIVEECDINVHGNSVGFQETNSHLSNHLLKLVQCVNPIFLPRTLDVLCHYCPSIDKLHIDQSEITLQGEFNEMTSDHHKLSLVLSHCPRSLPVVQILDSVCQCCSLSSLMVDNCEINYENVETSPVPKSYHLLQCLILDNLTQPVNLVRVVDNIYRHCPWLVEIIIQDSDLINDEDIKNIKMPVEKPTRFFKTVHLLRCKKPIQLARTFQPFGYLIPTSLEFVVEECDINLQGICSESKETDSDLSNHILTLSQCKEPVNLPRTLGVLCHYCPSITGLRIQQSKISLDPVFIYIEYISQHTLKEMHLSDCKPPINIPGIIDLMCYCCSSLVCLNILNSEISLKDLRPALTKRLHRSLKEINISHVDPTRVGYARKLLRHYCPSLEKVTIN